MSDLIEFLLALVYAPGVVGCAALAAALWADGEGTPRTRARLALAAPVWPVVVAWLIVRYVPRFIGRLFVTAFGSERDE